MPTVDEVIVWIIVGLIGGSLASRIVTWDRSGFGRVRDLGLGMAGALIGGLLFKIFGWLPALDRITVSLRNIVAAVIGSLILLLAIWLWQRFKPAH